MSKEVRMFPLSFSWIGESRPFSWRTRGAMALARDAYTPSWLAGQKRKVGKKKKPCGKKAMAKKTKRVKKKSKRR